MAIFTLSTSFDVWVSQTKLTMYEIEDITKRIMTTQPFLNSLPFTIELKMKQIYTLFCSFTLFILDS